MLKPKCRSAASPLCATPQCQNKKAVLGRRPDGSKRLANYCGTCRNRLWRKRHPAAAAFYNLKHRAKERGKQFLITRQQFEDWCEKTGYHLLKARNADGMSIDRIREDGPYSIGNIQMMPLGKNSSKAGAYRAAQIEGPVEPDKPYTESEDPFRP